MEKRYIILRIIKKSHDGVSLERNKQISMSKWWNVIYTKLNSITFYFLPIYEAREGFGSSLAKILAVADAVISKTVTREGSQGSQVRIATSEDSLILTPLGQSYDVKPLANLPSLCKRQSTKTRDIENLLTHWTYDT